ncbi:ROK family protein [Aureimonas sp. AU40]|uniref:ROK family protein n=1 Tax=Aureimonas sp. AU40 TaxID=1637747 RepID=UPI0009E6B546|nr:ROK family protein [Aureimonas sp. AU40]
MPDAPDLAAPHGAADLPVARVESHSLDIREDGGFLGDKASETAFRTLLDLWRERLSGQGDTPFGNAPTEELERDELDETLHRPDNAGEAEALDGALQDFAVDLADVLGRFLASASWAGVERIVCGGGLQSSRVGQEAVRRAEAILREEHGRPIPLSSLHHAPDDGGMVGWAYAAPAEVLGAGNAFLAVDIGGTNLRCGVVALEQEGREPRVVHREKWCHADDEPSREEVLERIGMLLCQAADEAGREGLRLAPFVGLSCPGLVRPDGSFAGGVQNLPGDWTEPGFRLPELVRRAVPRLRGHPTMIRLHNDAVIQGLSEWPFMRDVDRWAAVTIGTGLGNCAFRNRSRG